MTNLNKKEISGVSTENMKRLTGLAEKVYECDISQLTKSQIVLLLHMDMKTSITEVQVNVNATRPTEVKFATNSYFAGAKIDTSGMFDLMLKHLGTVAEDRIIDTYFEMKAVIYKMIDIKFESTEQYLRTLLEKAGAKDNCPKVGRFNE